MFMAFSFITFIVVPLIFCKINDRFFYCLYHHSSVLHKVHGLSCDLYYYSTCSFQGPWPLQWALLLLHMFYLMFGASPSLILIVSSELLCKIIARPNGFVPLQKTRKVETSLSKSTWISLFTRFTRTHAYTCKHRLSTYLSLDFGPFVGIEDLLI